MTIEVIAGGSGRRRAPALARPRSEDYDEVAAGLAGEGFKHTTRGTRHHLSEKKDKLKDITLHDLARDIATGDRGAGSAGSAVIVGHAYWQLGRAHDRGRLSKAGARCGGLAAAAAKKFPPELLTAINVAGNPALPKQQRLEALRFAFFAPGNDPAGMA